MRFEQSNVVTDSSVGNRVPNTCRWRVLLRY